MSRMTIECACERGGDCTSISACSADSMLQDQDEELQHKLASLTGEVDMWRKQVTELEAENTRLRLDQPPTARSTDPETSHEAAKNARFGQTMRQLNVLLTLHRSGSLTDFELAEHTGTQQTSIGKRRLECQHAGLVEPDTNFFDQTVLVRRPSRYGGKSMAQVWRLTEAGTVFIREWMERNDG